MRNVLFILILFSCSTPGDAQQFLALNTASGCSYMKPVEREMIYEINVARNHPEVYTGYLQKLLEEARDHLKHSGSMARNYSVETQYTTVNGKTTVTTDTTWFSINEEEVKAIESLVSDLKKLKPLGILKPDAGIYKAAENYAADQDRHGWRLRHQGSDGSWPDARIRRASPSMTEGNENIAGKSPEPSAREVVLQLLIDSGIQGYGHRYNILNPRWTHVACFCGGLKDGMYRWLQEFGRQGK